MRELTQSELDQIALAGITSEELAAQWDLFPDQEFDTAVGSVVMLKNGQGQERNEGFVEETAPAVEAQPDLTTEPPAAE